jgi:hypothetical protein
MDDLKKLIEDTLEIPCKLESESITYPAATIGDYYDSPALFGDGMCTAETSSISIGLWYMDRAGRDSAVKKLKKVLPDAGYTAPTAHKYFDTAARVFRATLDTEKLIKEE